MTRTCDTAACHTAQMGERNAADINGLGFLVAGGPGLEPGIIAFPAPNELLLPHSIISENRQKINELGLFGLLFASG